MEFLLGILVGFGFAFIVLFVVVYFTNNDDKEVDIFMDEDAYFERGKYKR